MREHHADDQDHDSLAFRAAAWRNGSCKGRRCYGEITVGHGWGNVRSPDHNEPKCFFTYKWKGTASRHDIPDRDARLIEEVCAAAVVGNDKGLYCQIIGKFRKAKDGVPQLTKLKGVKVINDKSVKPGR